MAPPKAPDKPFAEQSHKELNRTAKAAKVEFSGPKLKKEEKIRELRDANVADPADEAEDDVDVEGEGDRPDTESQPPTDLGDNQYPPADEETPVDTTATSSITEPEAVGEPGPVAPGLVDKDVKEAALERAGDRTSDPATRSSDARASEVEADRLSADAKPSDAGPEAYPFPPAGDVDIALVPREAHDGEREAPIPVGSWVRLKEHDDVPDRLIGHIATVTNSPTVLCNCDFAPRTHEHQSENQPLTVQMRDETNATLLLYPDAFQTVARDGRHEVMPIG